MSVPSAPVDSTWESVPAPGHMAESSVTYTQDRLERTLAVVIGVGSAIIGLQAFLDALATTADFSAARIAQMVVVFVPLACMIVTCFVRRGVRVAAAAAAAGIVLALLTWAGLLEGEPPNADKPPWIFLLVNVAVAASVLSMSRAVQWAIAILLPIVYGVQRLVRGDFIRDFWISTAFDASFALILGGVIVTLASVFRASAARVDEARQVAIASYSAARSAVAAEQERVAVAALMHDSVLAALLAAERADSPRSRDLAVSMASEALTRLANSEASALEHGNDQPVETSRVVMELRRALADVGADAVVEPHGQVGLIPDRVARAIVLAARQAISNAVNHAQGRGLHVRVDCPQDNAIAVTVSDAGSGFDTETIAEDRLGIRASISARMAGVAGTAQIESSASGTQVILSWGAGL